MKKKGIFKMLVSLMGVMLMSVLTLGAVEQTFSTSVLQYWWVAPAIKVAVQFYPQRLLVSLPKNSFLEASIVTIFKRDIEENIYPNNEFYHSSVDDSPLVEVDSMTGARYVKTGVAGAVPNTVRDREVYPKPVVQRDDDSHQYTLTHISNDANRIGNFEEFIHSYNKRQSLLRNHIEKINKETAEILMDVWFPNGADNIVRTSSTSKRGPSTGQSGDRKLFSKDDFITIAEKFNRMDVPQSGRRCVLPAEFLSDLLKIDGFVEADKIGKANLIEGTIGRLLGFDIYMRSSVARYTNDGTPVYKPFGSASATSDNLAGLFWYEGWVNRATGSPNVMIEENKPAYDGSILSIEAWAGGKIRKDKKGVIALVQTAG